MIITSGDNTTHHIYSQIALFKHWLTQNKLKYIEYKLTKYSNETRIYEVMIRKSRENPLTLLRHKSYVMIRKSRENPLTLLRHKPYNYV